MNDVSWRRFGGWCGIAFVVLEMTGQSMFQVGGGEPTFNASTAEVLDFFTTRDAGLVALGGYLSLLASVAFVWFLGSLWANLKEAEGPPAWISAVALLSGVIGLASSVTSGASWPVAIFRMHDGYDPLLAQTLFDLGNFGFANLWVWTASMLLATAVVILGAGALRRWLGWYALVAAIALLVGRAFWAEPTWLIFVPPMLFWVWVIAVGIVLIRQPRPAAAAAIMT